MPKRFPQTNNDIPLRIKVVEITDQLQEPACFSFDGEKETVYAVVRHAQKDADLASLVPCFEEFGFKLDTFQQFLC